MGLLDVLRILGDGQHIEPGRGALLGNAVLHLHAVSGFLRAGRRLHGAAGPGQGHADLAVGQVGDELGRAEVGDARPQFRQVLLGLPVVLRIVAVGRQAQVMQHFRDDLGG
ncbi:hypothetical protein D3C77_685120 [compost metagenome]